MSNAMSRSRSRWKGALLATVATAAITPLAAKAQSLTIGLYADPLAGTSPNDYANAVNGKPLANAYIDPFATDTLYVYGQVTGTSAPSASYVDGIQFAYFNVNASASLASFGTITPNLIPQFNGGNQNGSSGNSGAGAQTGTVGTIGTTSSIVQGGSTLTTYVKARSNNDVFNAGVSNGSNAVISGNSVYFLLETLTYTPNSATVLANPSAPAPGSAQSVSFNVSIPAVTSPYVQGNYFVGLPSTPTLSPGAANTFTGVSSTAGNVKLTAALPGDANLDGTVNGADFTILNNDFNLTGQTWTQGDFTGDGIVNGADFTAQNNTFNESLGAGPSLLAGATAQIGSSVPEPASLAILALGGASLLGRRRKI